MRRLILEIPKNELTKIGIELPQVEMIKTFEVLYFLSFNPKEFAAIAKVEYKVIPASKEELLGGNLISEVQILEKNKNTFTVFMRGMPILTNILESADITGGYLFPPLAINDDKVKFSFIGSELNVKELLKEMDNIGMHHRVVMLSDANFSLSSPLNSLTKKQRNLLIFAFKNGYYDVPRKINSDQLAKKFGLVNSTVVEHLRKAEYRLLSQLLANQT